MKIETFDDVRDLWKRREELIFKDGVKTLFSNFDHNINKWFISYMEA